jgi:hypothetical protein
MLYPCIRSLKTVRTTTLGNILRTCISQRALLPRTAEKEQIPGWPTAGVIGPFLVGGARRPRAPGYQEAAGPFCALRAVHAARAVWAVRC